MTSYMRRIERTPLVANVETTLTTGGVDYDGTALEVCDDSDTHLFHIVVDPHGERQILFFGSAGDYRMRLELLEKIVETAKEKVRMIDF